MNTDASLCCFCVEYQGFVMVFASRDVRGSALVRLVGQLPKGRPGDKKDSATKDKAGHCPCCAAATQVASRSSFALGLGDALKAQWVYHRK